MVSDDHPPLDPETGALAALGQRLRLARLRRQVTAKDLAEEAGITRVTLRKVERGEPAVMMGTYLRVMSALSLEQDLMLLARDDTEGRRLQDERLVRPATASRPRRIRLTDFPRLQEVAWSTSPQTSLSPEEAFALYERNWRHLDPDTMDPKEKALVARLTATVGKGVLLV